MPDQWLLEVTDLFLVRTVKFFLLFFVVKFLFYFLGQVSRDSWACDKNYNPKLLFISKSTFYPVDT